MSGSRIDRRSLVGAGGLMLASPMWASPMWASPVWAAPVGGRTRVAIETDKGVIVIQLEDRRAPLTSANFLRYVDAHRYDGGTIYRASREKGAPGHGTIEGGPNPAARRFPPVAHESTAMTGLRHTAGAISLARNEPGTGAGDFFICASAEPFLDAHPGGKGDNQGYAVFGAVVQGMEVVRRILALPTNGKTDIGMMRGQIIAPPVQIRSMKRT